MAGGSAPGDGTRDVPKSTLGAREISASFCTVKLGFGL
jgi:hypothetical protein